MDKRIFIAAAVTLVIALIGLLCYNYFEIYEYKETVYPSREINNNSYYAMEKWLTETGHQVRLENELYTANLEKRNEKVIVVNSRTLYIEDPEEIKQWIFKGGFFILVLEQYTGSLNENISDFLAGFGITSEYKETSIIIQDTEKIDEESGEKTENEDSAVKTEAETNKKIYPDFQNRLNFYVESDEEFFSISDIEGNIKLVEFSIGDGALTVIGIPVFMYNYNIKREPNAVLAWNLTAGRIAEEIPDEEKSILFIRSSNRYVSDSFFQTIMERGNIIPVIVSPLLLIFLGFWMVIPGFGTVPEEKQRMARPLKDRFTAEIRFLKKYNALNYYLKAFEREENSLTDKTYDYRELINYYRRLIDGTAKF